MLKKLEVLEFKDLLENCVTIADDDINPVPGPVFRNYVLKNLEGP
ncbi:MAG: hypothetical protein ACXWQX_08770 [Bdellovibrio sp.]